MAMVVKANAPTATWAATFSLRLAGEHVGIGFNHFWHAPTEDHGGDCCTSRAIRRPASMRAPSSKAVCRKTLLNFRREVDGKGLSSYPHPKLMPNFWQFPTVSMGLGPLMAIYQARFLKYLHARSIAKTEQAQGVGILRRRRDGRAGIDGRVGMAGT